MGVWSYWRPWIPHLAGRSALEEHGKGNGRAQGRRRTECAYVMGQDLWKSIRRSRGAWKESTCLPISFRQVPVSALTPEGILPEPFYGHKFRGPSPWLLKGSCWLRNTHTHKMLSPAQIVSTPPKQVLLIFTTAALRFRFHSEVLQHLT